NRYEVCRVSEMRLPPSTLRRPRSEEHTSELQSRSDLVCRLLLEKKKTKDRAATRAVRQDHECRIPSFHTATRAFRRSAAWSDRPACPLLFFFLRIRRPPRSTLFPYPTLFR